MDPKAFADKAVRIAGTTKIEPVSIVNCDPDYKLILYADDAATTRGLVTVAKLVPQKITVLPEFALRWDHGKAELDVDIYLDGRLRKDLWNQAGYKGHHTILADSNGREYNINVEIPGRQIFAGTLRVGFLAALNLHESIKLSEYVNVEVVDDPDSVLRGGMDEKDVLRRNVVGLSGLFANSVGAVLLAISIGASSGGVMTSGRSGFEYGIAIVNDFFFKLGLTLMILGFGFQILEKWNRNDTVSRKDILVTILVSVTIFLFTILFAKFIVFY